MISFFNKIVDVLEQFEIPYMLSGSVAMGVYVVPRSTRDFDFVVYLQPKDLKNFTSSFVGEYYCDHDAVNDAINVQSIFNIIDYASGYKADFVVLKNEEYRQLEFQRKVKITVFNRIIYIVTAEDLLLSKIIWIQILQSSIQMDDIRNLAEVENLDWIYITNWIKKLKLNTFNLIKNDRHNN